MTDQTLPDEQIPAARGTVITGRAPLDMAYRPGLPNYTHPLSPEKEAAIEGLVEAARALVPSIGPLHTHDCDGVGDFCGCAYGNLRASVERARAAGLTKE